MNNYNNKIQVIHIKDIPSSKSIIKTKSQQCDLFEECSNLPDTVTKNHTNNNNLDKSICLYAYIGRAKRPSKSKQNSTKSETSLMDESFSILCNPFRISNDNSRQDVIIAYKKYAHEQMKIKGNFFYKIQELVNILKNNQYDKIYLVCFCKPHDCHGDIVKEIVLDCLEKQKQFSDAKDLLDK